MSTVTPSDTVAALVELSKKHGGKQFLRDVLTALQRELGGQGTIEVSLVTPTGNAGALAKKVSDLLEKKFGRPVAVSEKADASLIGGVILQFGDERVDLSVRGALEQFEQTLRAQAL